jgi:hypothetical protein
MDREYPNKYTAVYRQEQTIHLALLRNGQTKTIAVLVLNNWYSASGLTNTENYMCNISRKIQRDNYLEFHEKVHMLSGTK